ncbi:MAG: hypothetical protein ACOX7R_11420 [Acetivibrionales bacterium]|jgi:hypothetical protein
MAKQKNKNRNRKKASRKSPAPNNDQLGENPAEGRLERKKYEEYRDI